MTESALLKLFPNMSKSTLEANLATLPIKTPSTGIVAPKKGIPKDPCTASIEPCSAITFSIEVVPRSVQFGKRMGINRKTGKMIMFCDKKTKKFYDDITAGAARFAPKTPLEGPLMVEMTMYFPRPKRLLGKNSPVGPIWMPSRPDAENLFKGVADPLTKLGFWKDDAQIVDQRCQKLYCHKDLSAEIVIRIEPLT